ncbi:DivIVA domain-containing protein [Blastococcus goldschmidtiae]|uniref:DivIVA domain-containing protein n=1 Tax=Blastococcus goldschmidtiae TaxID=3075546 RepID=A0ABU2K9G6_9ACTN|nr:DivIVA domain-containing protein [Blastococcus sp. DSM 46792]MDT0276783.1 DivIVA domain-containing protein [Blastococcus sp. DSM 46792]
MPDLVLSLVGVLVIAALLFLGASLLLGRGESRPPADPGRSPVELPVARPMTGDDVRGLRMTVSLRGYRMTEVDWLLEQFARTLDDRDVEIAALTARLHPVSPGELKSGRTPPRDDDEESPHA